MITFRRPAVDLGKDHILAVGVGDWVVSDAPATILATYALGSCIGITAFDAQVRAGGLLHFMLPDSSLNPDKARLKPGIFCDSGLPRMIAELEALGASRRRMQVFVAGAAKVLDGGDFFDTGRRNQLAARRRLWELGLVVENEDMGGDLSRTLKLSLDSGRLTVRDVNGERELGHSLSRRR